MSIKLTKSLALCLLCCAVSGCGSTPKRGLMAGAGAAAAGFAAKKFISDDPLMIAGATIAGGAATMAALGEDKELAGKNIMEGYKQGRKDAIKHHYWLQQNLEKRHQDGGQTTYYTFDAEVIDTDGVSKVPHKITVPVVE